MNSIILFSVILVTSQLSLASKKDNSIILSPQDNNCQSHGLQCRDCESIQFCSSDLEPVFQMKCSDQSKTRPHCDSETNSCVKTKPAVCAVEQSSFTCPGEGTYPDLENCFNYYICDENKNASKYACAAGHHYNHEIQGCSLGLFCKSYSSKNGLCKSKINKLIPYALNSDLFVLCLSGQPSMLFQCPNKGDTFNEEEVTCKFECTQAGFFTYYPDPSKFYSCVNIGKKFALNLLDCPEGTEFVQLTEGQGICTYRTTTTTTTTTTETTTSADIETTTSADIETTSSADIETTTQDEDNIDGEEGSGEAPEETESTIVNEGEDQQQGDILEDVGTMDLNSLVINTILLNEDLYNNEELSSESAADPESNDASASNEDQE